MSLATFTCKKTLLALHKDRCALRPKASFLFKVVSSFQLNRDIVLPSLCKISLYWPDMVYTVCVYLSVTALFQLSNSLFIILKVLGEDNLLLVLLSTDGFSNSSFKPMTLRGRVPPFPVKEHS